MPSPRFSVRRQLRRLAGAAALCTVTAGLAEAAPLVAVSIKPLEHLVAALTDGVSSPRLVVRTGQDPHHISLRPSERRLLADADLVLWVGPAMELPLVDLVAQLDSHVITAQSLPALTLLNSGADPDPHLWLDTGNAQAIAAAVTGQLVALDNVNAARYQANLERFNNSMQVLRSDLQQRFSRSAVQHWAVYHHAFRYLEHEFGLPAALTLRESDNVEPGLRSVLAFRAALQAARLACLVTEPGLHQHDLEALLDDDALHTVEADVLGVQLPVTADSFAALISGVAEAIQSCSGGTHE